MGQALMQHGFNQPLVNQPVVNQEVRIKAVANGKRST